MSFEEIIHGHIPFSVAIVILLLVLAFFIYMAVKMFRNYNNDKSPDLQSEKKKAKTYGILFAVCSGITGLVIIMACMLHYHISIKNYI